MGFGDPVHVQRAVWDFEAAGAVAVEFEDQVSPKRVHHHVGVEHLVSVDEMCSKVEAAVAARSDADFLIIARTGGMRHEGVDAGIARLQAYVNAGADIAMAFCRDQDLERVAREVVQELSFRQVVQVTGVDEALAPDPFPPGDQRVIEQVLAEELLAPVRGPFPFHQRSEAAPLTGRGRASGACPGTRPLVAPR